MAILYKLAPLFIIKRAHHLLLFFVLFSSFISAQAQQRCGTVEYTKRLMSNGLHENDDRFERWLSKKIADHQKLAQNERTQSTTYQIPVVVHIIHNGEAIGKGTNISDAQIASQIAVLNKDFKRLNKDTLLTPAEFLPVAGKMNIEFVLARQNPQGLATTGIVRVKGSKTSWNFFDSGDDDALKSTSYWPADDYFNIWVCNLTGALGYTQFPVSSLPGLENSPNNALTDGVVIGYTYFGTTDAGAFNLKSRYDKGRTVTHEVGHFFGLRHIWGDVSSCSGNGDYVNDTPFQDSETSGCPSGVRTSCTHDKMYQNYLDYTDDACMNMFSAGQVARMITVLENSPRRTSLLTSHGLSVPVPFPNDLALLDISSPPTNTCTNLVTPSINVANIGTNTITSAKIQLKVNSIISETKDFVLSLGVNSSQTLTFTAQNLAEGNALFEFGILQTNGTTDGNIYNNNQSITTLYSIPVATPYEQDFSTLPPNWLIDNPDGQTTWQNIYTVTGSSIGKAMVLDYYDYTAVDATDALISPPLDLTNQTKAYLSFDVSHASRFQSNSDQLQVVMLTGCNTDVSVGTELYNKAGNELATSLPTNLYYVPTSQDDWRTELIDISAYAGQKNIRVAFIGTNMNGNNIYIDSVKIIHNSYVDLSIARVVNPTDIACDITTPKLNIRNLGTSSITSFTIKSNLNGTAQPDKVVTGLHLAPGSINEVTLDPLTLNATTNNITFTITDVNGGVLESNSLNNEKSVSVLPNTVSNVIPIKENFDQGLPSGWTSFSPTDGMLWTAINSDSHHKKSVYVNDFGNDNIGEQAWLITPLLDFSLTDKASVSFDRSYGYTENSSDELKVLASTGCGNSFDEVLYDKSDYSLSNANAPFSWMPASDKDWTREFVTLPTLAGKKDVRLAFVMINQNGNNLYLDNIEFYASDSADISEPTKKFSIYYKNNSTSDFTVKFYLDEQQTAALQVVDILGRIVLAKSLEYTLNQAYDVLLEDATSGIYIVKLQTTEGSYTQRVLLNK